MIPETQPCKNCGAHPAHGGGTYGSGDPYGDRRKMGMPPDEATTGYFCLRCEDAYSDADKKAEAEIDAEFERRGLCGFLECWVGRCRAKKPCKKHRKQKCWQCGEPAIANCSIASSLVCGMPYCSQHPHERAHY